MLPFVHLFNGVLRGSSSSPLHRQYPHAVNWWVARLADGHAPGGYRMQMTATDVAAAAKILLT